MTNNQSTNRVLYHTDTVNSAIESGSFGASAMPGGDIVFVVLDKHMSVAMITPQQATHLVLVVGWYLFKQVLGAPTRWIRSLINPAPQTEPFDPHTNYTHTEGEDTPYPQLHYSPGRPDHLKYTTMNGRFRVYYPTREDRLRVEFRGIRSYYEEENT